MNFGHWFLQRTSRLESWLITVSIMLIIVLAAVQVLLTRPSIRQFLSPVGKLEGAPVAETTEPAVTRPVIVKQGYVELSIISGAAIDDLKVFVNGEEAGAFAGKRSLVVPVYDGDLLEIDGELPEENVVITVTAVSDDIAVPKKGKKVVYFGRPETVSYVSLRTDH
ncbi:MAG: hypothetical protein QM368_06170 [Bacillota bacterium]|nr:hypothetical protein [Bacillota bacterium]HHU30662.1 hypothetical protein [Bacillota bacterium]